MKNSTSVITILRENSFFMALFFGILLSTIPSFYGYPKVGLSLILILGILITLSALFRLKEKLSNSQVILLLFTLGVVLVFSFAKLYEVAGLKYNDSLVNDFETSIYFSIVTWTTLGYGDLQPSESIRIWASSQALIGYIYMAVCISICINILVARRENQRALPLKKLAIQKALETVQTLSIYLTMSMKKEYSSHIPDDHFMADSSQKYRELDKFISNNASVLGADLLALFTLFFHYFFFLNNKISMCFRIPVWQDDFHSQVVLPSPVNDMKGMLNTLSAMNSYIKGSEIKIELRAEKLSNRIISIEDLEVTWSEFSEKYEVCANPQEFVLREGEGSLFVFNVETLKSMKVDTSQLEIVCHS